MNINYSSPSLPFFPLVLPTRETLATHPILYICYIVETILLLLCIPTLALCCRELSKSVLFHRNLIYITQFHFCTFLLSLVVRPIIMFYSMGIIHNVNGDILSNPLLVAACFVNFFCRCTSLSAFTSILAERYFASYFVKDYETSRRRWVAVCVIVMSCAQALALSAPFIFGLFSVGTFSIFVILFGIACAVIYVILYRHENNQLRLLTIDDKSIRYKLTTRFQLAENLRVLEDVPDKTAVKRKLKEVRTTHQKIEKKVESEFAVVQVEIVMYSSIIYSIWVVVPCTLALLVFLYFTIPSAKGQLYFGILDLFIAASILVLYLFLLVSLHKGPIARVMHLQRDRRRKTMLADRKKATDIYFQQLSTFWK